MTLPGLMLSSDHQVHLRTARLVMRHFTAEDAPLLVELDSDPEVVRYVGQGEPTTLELVAHTVLPKLLGYHHKHPQRGLFATHEVSTGVCVGWMLYRPEHDAPHGPELGYRLFRREWGKGYATEGSLALLNHGFQVLGDADVVAHAFKANRASTRVMEKCGMELERETMEQGAPLLRYAINSRRWRERA